MKNMKVRTKLFFGFIIVTAIGMMLGAVGIISVMMIKSISDDIKLLQIKSMGASGVLSAHYVWRHSLTESVLTGGEFTGSLDPDGCALGKWLDSDEAKAITDSVVLELLKNISIPHEFIHREAQNIVQSMSEGRRADAIEELENSILPKTQEVITLLTQMQERFADLIEEENQQVSTLQNLFITVFISFIVAAAALSMLLTVYISGLISKPMAPLTAFFRKAGENGDFSIEVKEKAVLDAYAKNEDELGELTRCAGKFVEHVTGASGMIEAISKGDMSGSVHVLTNEDTLGTSLKNMLDNFNIMFGEIKSASSQVFTGAEQIANGAQILAQGSTEQAATAEQLSASISDISEKTRANAEMSGKAATLANSIKGKAEKGSRQMDEMMAAVIEISRESKNISKVIKVIDDIAFQTNILALNAAVEAARAGQHGKGFAVVADEVRNLAAKSAEAAKDTSNLVAESMERAEQGALIAKETATSLLEIVEGINESSDIINEIAKSSEAQSLGIGQINSGIDQVARVVQQNSATAEESAAASEQLSGQSSILEQLIENFTLRDSSTVRGRDYSRRARAANPEITAIAINRDAEKY